MSTLPTWHTSEAGPYQPPISRWTKRAMVAGLILMGLIVLVACVPIPRY